MTSAARHKPILPWWQLGLLLVGCAVGIWFLLPDDPGLLEDLVRDGNTREARRLLAKMSPDEHARDARRLRVIELKIARLELKGDNAEATARFWKLAVETWRDSQFSGEVFLEFAPVIPRLNDPAAAWEILLPILPGAPEPLRQRLADNFTRAALAANQPAQAAQIFAHTHPAAGRTVENSLELARLWELGGKPLEALAALGSDQSPEVTTRRIAILRELNRNREAFALLRARAEALPDGSPDAALMEELTTTALAAGTPNEAVPLLQRYAAKNPTDLAVQRRLRDVLVSSGRAADAVASAREAVKLGSRQPADLRELAKILEYSSEGEQAFEFWLELRAARRLARRGSARRAESRRLPRRGFAARPRTRRARAQSQRLHAQARRAGSGRRPLRRRPEILRAIHPSRTFGRGRDAGFGRAAPRTLPFRPSKNGCAARLRCARKTSSCAGVSPTASCCKVVTATPSIIIPRSRRNRRSRKCCNLTSCSPKRSAATTTSSARIACASTIRRSRSRATT